MVEAKPAPSVKPVVEAEAWRKQKPVVEAKPAPSVKPVAEAKPVEASLLRKRSRLLKQKPVAEAEAGGCESPGGDQRSPGGEGAAGVDKGAAGGGLQSRLLWLQTGLR